MARNKQKQIDEVGSFANVFDYPKEMKGLWNKEYFKNDGAIVLELGCGWGQYTLALAEKFPEKNFIGIDKKGDRIWQGAKRGLGSEKMQVGAGKDFTETALRNVAFSRFLIEKIGDCFEEGEVDEIWVTFPDPHPKPCRANKRLISPRFLELYRKVCKGDAVVHLKTDNIDLFEYALETVKADKCLILEEIRDVHSQNEVPDLLKTLTYYERKFMDKGMPINYLRFSLAKGSAK